MSEYDDYQEQSEVEVDEAPAVQEQADPFIETIEKTADIVTQTIQDGKYEAVRKNLEQVAEKHKEKERYVFERPSLTWWIIALVVSVAFSVGFLYFIFIAIGTLMYSATYWPYGLYGLLISLMVILINALMVAMAVKEIRFYKRYDHYQNILRFRNIEIVNDLAEMLEIDRSIVEKDLKRAVKRKLIPQGHFGRNNVIFMVANHVFGEYSKRRAVYDRYFRKLIEERERMGNQTKETREILEQGEEYIGKIRDSNDIIKDKEFSDKLDRMEKIVSAIFHEVEINPAQASKLGVFMSYYLPTTEKLLETYIELDERPVKGHSVEKTQNDIANALDSINNAYEGLLERFYQEQERNITGEIFAMETIMKQEGLSIDGE